MGKRRKRSVAARRLREMEEEEEEETLVVLVMVICDDLLIVKRVVEARKHQQVKCFNRAKRICLIFAQRVEKMRRTKAEDDDVDDVVVVALTETVSGMIVSSACMHWGLALPY